MNTNSKLKVLVYGATGSQAGAVPTYLLKRGHQPYVVTRIIDKAAHHAQAGAIVVEGDMADANRLRELSEGMDAMSLLIPFFANPNEVLNYGRQAVDAAKVAGVKLLVWNTSGFIPPMRTGNPSIDVRIDMQEYLKQSGLPHIILQPSVYLENLLGPWTVPFVANEDRVAYPVPIDMRISWIASDDVSALVVAALERPELAGSNWSVNGLEYPDGTALAQAFSEGLGRPVDYYAMPPKDFGTILDQLFGLGAGAAAANEYQRLWDFPEQRPSFHADMQPVLEKLPVTMTRISEWVLKHKDAFMTPVLS